MKLILEHVVKDFSGSLAVKDVSLTLQDGKLTGLLGPSGCGKSTLLYMIAGLESVTSGRIYFDGQDVTEWPAEDRGVGLVFQNYALYPHMTVEQNIMFPLLNNRVKKSVAQGKALEMARFVQIDEYMNRKPAQLSGGQQQRVAIARALVKSPKILLLDEPLSNLDARLRLELREEIRRIQIETGVTTVFVTHDQEEAMSITDELVLMKAGIIQQIDAPQTMYRHPQSRFVASFLGNPPINFFDVEADAGQIILSENLKLKFPISVFGHVVLGIRPEGWIPGDGINVEIINVSVRGREQHISFLLHGQKAHAILDTADIVKPGDKISLTLKLHCVHLFDPENGVRLGEGDATYVI